MGIMSWLKGGDGASNPWRRLYDPGMPPKPAEGSSYYDTVKDTAKSPSVWDAILQSEEFRRRSFDSIDSDHDGYITKDELQRVVPKGTNTEALVTAADTTGTGKISRSDYIAVTDKHFGTA